MATDYCRAFVDGDFPQELYQMIFLLLDGHDLVAMEDASTFWNAIIDREQIWHKKVLAQWPYLTAVRAHPDHWAMKSLRIGPDHSHSEFPFLLSSHTSWRQYFLERRLTEVLSSSVQTSNNESFLRGLQWTGRFIKGMEGDIAAALDRSSFPVLEHMASSARKKTASQQAQCQQALQALRQNFPVFAPNLRSLSLCDGIIAAEDISLVPGILSIRPTLTTLDLSGNDLGIKGISILAKALESDRHLLCLNVASNDIQDEGCFRLSRMLGKNSVLEKLSLAHNSIGKDGILALAAVMSWTCASPGNVSPMQEIDPSSLLTPRTKPPTVSPHRPPQHHHLLGPSSQDSIPSSEMNNDSLNAEPLLYNRSLTSLDISNNPVGRHGIEQLAAALQSNVSLTELNVRYVGFPGNTTENIFAGKIPLPPFLACVSLKKLNIGFNDMVSTSPEYPEAILEGLKENNTLTFLDMQRTCIGGWRRAFAIGQGLRLNYSLTSVDLSYNWIGAGGNHVIVNEYAEALRQSHTLVKVGLAHNLLGPECSLTLVEAALEGSVEHLDLQYNCIGQTGLVKVVRALEEATRNPHSQRTCHAQYPVSDMRQFEGLVRHQQASGGCCGSAKERKNSNYSNTSMDDESSASKFFSSSTNGRRPLLVNLCGNVQISDLLYPNPCLGERIEAEARNVADRSNGALNPKRRKVDRRDSVQVFEHDKYNKRRLPSPAYMEVQTKGVLNYCRSILHDWLMDLADAFLLPDEALFRAVHYADLYLSCVNVQRTKYQLVGAVALMIATNNFFSKLGMTDRTIASPNSALLPRDIVYYSDDSYSQEEVMTVEGSMLQFLDFDLEYHSPLCYLTQYCSAVTVDDKVVSIALEIARQCTKEYAILRLHPSAIAACALYLAMRCCQLSWPDVLSEQTGYTTAFMVACEDHFKFLRGRDKELKCKSILERCANPSAPVSSLSPKYNVSLDHGVWLGDLEGPENPTATTAP
mmetsp:Transcript_2615/g.4022  ORF Transcript_2615/g.4022 Transcript_2615/m.4022 type:complete len:980 (-) Transcript_2615:733-3672(-)|eukprot:CAMPEP_0184340474 /NCGR_PEP_ID=MMETSP1089-20130417/9151_1 /TAXON_ID=38269 ORGANISM="Gloeochaete wittrockiana, Strain SAG46.84" /NCGR_SAMPLE_ID=MMETSP1089 /ASSEMBLY_ACC=CAM_ASM_000445 /LENGTH=979 /DNA_ID=CAMNT_0026668305 /DNA_START=88 /DNA_END=3027 /DNA_ORIENTATION=+